MVDLLVFIFKILSSLSRKIRLSFMGFSLTYICTIDSLHTFRPVQDYGFTRRLVLSAYLCIGTAPQWLIRRNVLV